MKKIIAYLDCNPWEDENGRWHIAKTEDPKYIIEIEDTQESFEILRDKLEDKLEQGLIHSFFMKRHEDPPPIQHECE
jgi:hypothetical protein